MQKAMEWRSSNTRDRDAILIIWIMIVLVLAGVLGILNYPTSDFTMPNIFHAPIETIPLDFGWTGFVFILVNGFLLSLTLVRYGLDATERALLSVGLGFGTTYVMMILIGILWEISFSTVLLTQVSLLLTLLLGTFYRGLKPSIFYKLRIERKRMHITKSNIFEATVLMLIGVYMCIALYQTVAYPPIEWDSLAYGVNYAKIIFEKGTIPLIAGPSIGLEMSASYPPGVQLLAVYLYTLAGSSNDFYFRILQPMLGLATMIATYKFAMIMTKNRTASVFAMLILSVMPTFWEVFVQETYLMCLTLMLTLSVFFFFKAYRSNDVEAKKLELVGTLFCCFSALTSFIGVFSFGLLFLYSLKRQIPAKRFIWLAILAIVIVFPWFMRNLVLLGNPLYPFFGIGKYLDSMLLTSTMQHFQNWTKVPLFGLFSVVSKIGAGLLLSAIVYLMYTKRKLFLLILPSYLLLVGLVIMATHIPFIRYLVIAMPALAVILSESTRMLLATRNVVKSATPIILIGLILILIVPVLPSINSYKPTPTFGNDKSSYLIQVFEEGDAWKWIKENTPKDSRIATYDIKEYYLEREVLQLDGNESAPLYRLDTIEEGISFLRERNVRYFLSIPWATPSEIRMPLAYEWSVLTRYLGDPKYLPPVYVGQNGTTVYHVGPIEEETIYASFAEKDFAPPLKHVTINLTIANETGSPSAQFHIPVPADYREGLMAVTFRSSEHLFDVELWNGIIKETGNTMDKSKLVMQWSVPAENISDVEDPSFVWQINRAGYFTFLIFDRTDAFKESFNVVIDIRFYNCWDPEIVEVPI